MTIQEKINNIEMIKKYVDKTLKENGYIKEYEIEEYLLVNNLDEMLETVLNMLSIKYNSISEFNKALNTAINIYYYNKDIQKFDNIDELIKYFR